ncbi:MAG: hypothetical protein ACREAO_05925, partial [Nitrososphaera sp.]
MKFQVSFLGLIVAVSALASVSAHSIPAAYAATTMISANTVFGSLIVNEGDTLVISQGVEVGAESITNNGTIINRGSLVAGSFINGGTIDSYGLFSFNGNGSNDGGTIN